jgi:hypothetical protein
VYLYNALVRMHSGSDGAKKFFSVRFEKKVYFHQLPDTHVINV